MFDVALCGVHAAPERSCECMASMRACVHFMVRFVGP